MSSWRQERLSQCRWFIFGAFCLVLCFCRGHTVLQWCDKKLCFLFIIWDSELWGRGGMDWVKMQTVILSQSCYRREWGGEYGPVCLSLITHVHSCISLLRLSLLPQQAMKALTVTAWMRSDKTIPLPSRPCLLWEACSLQISPTLVSHFIYMSPFFFAQF